VVEVTDRDKVETILDCLSEDEIIDKTKTTMINNGRYRFTFNNQGEIVRIYDFKRKKYYSGDSEDG
jgi:predicted transcriptional regulator